MYVSMLVGLQAKYGGIVLCQFVRLHHTYVKGKYSGGAEGMQRIL